jgi:hypothetical protein
VIKDEATGLPKFVWGSNAPEDLYAERYGQRLLQPIVLGDGGPVLGDEFEIDADGKPYTAFKCSMLQEPEGEGCAATCKLYGKYDVERLETIRPRNCGDFPVFGLVVDDSLVAGNPFVPPTGALPRCTWHGIRIVGPWKDTTYWRARWEQQQAEKEG